MKSSHRLANVRGFLLDMDGTFYMGERLLDGSLRFIQTIRSQDKDFLFLTNNSSKSRQQYAQKITSLGLSIAIDKILTSGEATAIYLNQTSPQARIYLVGTPALEEEFLLNKITLVEENPDYVVLGFDTTLTYKKLWKLCDLVRAGIPYIATHPDFNCPTETGYMPDIGAMIAFVKASTNREPDLVIGKPNRMIVDAASIRMGLPIDKLCMIGDRLYTDIAIGRTSNITTLLVLTGETRMDDLRGSQFQPDYIFNNLGEVADWLERNAV
jgi:HAD superfamily hydrolase (TIGR01457 family)